MNHYDWHLKEQLMGTSLPPQLLGSPHLIQNRGASNRIPLPLPLPPSLPFPAPWLQWTCKKTQHSLNSLNRLWLTAERSEIQHTKWKEAYLICLGGCQIIRYDRNRWPRRTAWSSNTSSCLAETKKTFYLGSGFQKRVTPSRSTALCSAIRHEGYANQMWLIQTRLIISHLYTVRTQWRV